MVILWNGYLDPLCNTAARLRHQWSNPNTHCSVVHPSTAPAALLPPYKRLVHFLYTGLLALASCVSHAKLNSRKSAAHACKEPCTEPCYGGMHSPMVQPRAASEQRKALNRSKRLALLYASWQLARKSGGTTRTCICSLQITSTWCKSYATVGMCMIIWRTSRLRSLSLTCWTFVSAA
jgi:hypothetical protein